MKASLAVNPYEANRGAVELPDRGALVAAHPSPRRGLCLPSRDQLDYARSLMIVVLMVLALPWLLRTAIRNPGKLVPAVPK